MLGWLGGARGESVEELIRKKRFDRAIPLLKAELEKRKNDRRLRLKLGDVLLAAGHTPEALKILRRLSDEMAMAGQVGQAIAVLKKIEAREPGREDVEERLAYLIEQRRRPAADPWARPGAAGGEAEPEELEIGFEPNRIEAGALGAPSASPESAPAAGPPEAPASAASTAATGDAMDSPGLREGEPEPTDDTLADELLAVIEDTLRPASSPTEPPEKAVETPLFKSLAQAELAALIRGLRLLTFEPGEVIVAEGEPGTSLFLITSGRARAYVRNPKGSMVQVRELQEGDFFGEIAVLRGHPRSATVTAGARSELLELDRASLDRITETHPNVRAVLEDFCAQRAGNTLETMIRGMDLGGRP